MAASNGMTLEYTPVDGIPQIVDGLRKAFATGKTRDIEWRKDQIKQVGFMVQDNEEAWLAALEHDLGRPKTESVLAEINLIYADVKEMVKKLPKWAKPEVADTDIMWAATRPKILKEPKGVVLVIAPFNYPVSLALVPLMGAIAGGNVCLLKPSEQTTAVAQLIARLVPKYLDPTCFQVVNGAKDQMVKLLELQYDHIFFTGSGNVGKIVAAAAAKFLTPVTLELGGKSPCIVLDDADVAKAARRIIWGKHVNAAQTCIAPDYVLCSKAMQPKLIEGFRKALAGFYPNNEGPLNSTTYSKLVSASAYDRLTGAVADTKGHVVIGGGDNKAKGQIDITVVADVALDDALMKMELFGPVLPIVPCETKEEAVRIVNNGEYPLAIYVFTNSAKNNDYVLANTRSGGAVRNDVMMQFAIPGLPFGGTGGSGYGNYHGKRSFDTFVHERAFVHVPNYMEAGLELRYPPYTANRLKWMRRLLGHTLRYSRPQTVGSLTSGSSGWLASIRRQLSLRWLLAVCAVVAAVRRFTPVAPRATH